LDRAFVAKHAWLPLIHYIKRTKRYKASKGKTVFKDRPIMYASHRDACILSKYAWELTTALVCENSNLTGIIDRLERRGLVERRPSPTDRRVRVLELTPAGVELRMTIIRRVAEPAAGFDALDDDDAAMLASLLADVAREVVAADGLAFPDAGALEPEAVG